MEGTEEGEDEDDYGDDSDMSNNIYSEYSEDGDGEEDGYTDGYDDGEFEEEEKPKPQLPKKKQSEKKDKARGSHKGSRSHENISTPVDGAAQRITSKKKAGNRATAYPRVLTASAEICFEKGGGSLFACVTAFDTSSGDAEYSFLLKAYIPEESIEMKLECPSEQVQKINRKLRTQSNASAFEVAENLVEVLRLRREKSGMRLVLSIPDADRAAAIRIQSQARVRIAKKEVREKRLLRSQKSSTRIQAIVRGRRDRKRVHRMRQDAATTKIQSVVRGKRDRKKCKERHRAATKLQSIQRRRAGSKRVL